MSDPLDTLWQSLQARLNGASAIWGDRAYPDFLPGYEDRPSVVYAHVAGGDDNTLRQRDATYLIQVMVIASNQDGATGAASDAMTGAAELSALIDDQGSQDVDKNNQPTDRAITGDENWEITTITQGTRLHQVDNWSKNGVAVYHDGHEFRVTMEEL